MRGLFLALLLSAPAAAGELGVGVNYLGGQLDYDFARGRRLEARYQTGKQSSAEGNISTSVAGVRAIQRFRLGGLYHPYLGAELAYVDAHVPGGTYRISGAAPGVFFGLERPLSGRLSAGADVGPYIFALEDRASKTGQTSVELVANVFLLLRVY